nr:MAG TPA: hypothetical protein [Caudoviricetes sp.]
MPVTQNYEFPLYDPEDSPDLTLTGREAGAIIAIDGALKNEENERIAGDTELNASLEKETAERKAADTALGGRIDAEVAAREASDTALGGRIDTEAAAREAADTALGGRIDNAEAEISANSADITGIKGLTYGNDHTAFLENNNGEYDSPALQEIEEQIAAGKLNVAIYGVTTFKEVQAMLPNVICRDNKNICQLSFYDDNQIIFFRLGFEANHKVYWITSRDNVWHDGIADTNWSAIVSKPFNSVGTGLNTASESLSLDTSYLPTVSAGSGVTVTPTTDGNHTKYEISSTVGRTGGISGNTTWAEMEA